VVAKYNFKYTMKGVTYHVWIDSKTAEKHFDAHEKLDELLELIQKVEWVIRDCDFSSDFDALEVRKFLLEHMRAMVEVGEESDRLFEAKKQAKKQQLN
jgi:hypothetical protein